MFIPPLWLFKVGGFLKANWKIIAIAIACIGVYFWYQHQISQAFRAGEFAEKTRWEQKIKTEGDANRKFEKFLDGRMKQYEILLDKRNDTRIEKETIHTNTIKEIIKNNPDWEKCRVDQSLLDERNAIRKLGPKVNEKVSFNLSTLPGSVHNN